MSNVEMETRISALEKELNILKSKFEKIEKKEEPKVAWREERAGMSADDPMYDEAIRLGREYRLAQREDYDKDEDEEAK